MKKLIKTPFVISLILIITLSFFYYLNSLNFLQDSLHSLFLPMQEVIHRLTASINNAGAFLSSHNLLKNENFILKEENTRLLSELIRMEEIESENEFLREQIKVSSSTNSTFILAEALGQRSSNYERFLLMDKGKKDGVRKGDIIITAGNVLVGRVAEVNSSFAKVRLITDSNSRINAIVRETETTGLIYGNNQDYLTLDLIPQDVFLSKDNLVITSGLSGIFPRGLLIGYIDEVFVSDISTSQTASIRIAVDLNKLKKLFVYQSLEPSNSTN